MTENIKIKPTIVDRIKRNPAVSIIGMLVALVVTIGAFLGAVDDIGLTFSRWFTTSKSLQPIIARDDHIQVDEDGEITFNVLGNDGNTDGYINLTVNANTTGTLGKLKNNGDGTFQYTPPTEFSGTDQFRYVVNSPDSTGSTATVRIEILEVNDPPISRLQTISAVYPRDAYFVVDLLKSVEDTEGDPVRLAYFEAQDTDFQPKRGDEEVQKFAAAVGPIPAEQKRKAAGMIVLPLHQWVEEANKISPVGSVERTIDYVIEDSRGASSTYSLSVVIENPKAIAAILTCISYYSRLPDRISFGVSVAGKNLAQYWYKSTNLDEFPITLIGKNIRIAQLLQDAELTASWKNSGYRVDLSCNSTIVLSSGDKIPTGILRINASTSETSGRSSITLNYAEIVGSSLNIGMEQLIGRPL